MTSSLDMVKVKGGIGKFCERLCSQSSEVRLSKVSYISIAEQVYFCTRKLRSFAVSLLLILQFFGSLIKDAITRTSLICRMSSTLSINLRIVDLLVV